MGPVLAARISPPRRKLRGGSASRDIYRIDDQRRSLGKIADLRQIVLEVRCLRDAQ